jgi:hypothetical protein
MAPPVGCMKPKLEARRSSAACEVLSERSLRFFRTDSFAYEIFEERLGTFDCRFGAAG